MKKRKEKSIFLKLLGIPYLIWFILTLLVYDQTKLEQDPITLNDLIVTNITVLVIWFIITLILTKIIWNKKSKSIKTFEKTTQPEVKKDSKIVAKTKETEENIKTFEKKKEQKKKKCLYSCESIINGYEYKKMAKYFPKEIYWFFVFGNTFFNILCTAFVAIFSKNWILTATVFILCQIVILIVCKIQLEAFAERTFISNAIKQYNLKKETKDFEIREETKFYDTYFIRKDEKVSLKINYSEISRCVENDTNFYLKYPQRNKIIILQKNRCSLELINFIRNTFKNRENHLLDPTKLKGAKKSHNPTFIKNGMLILFIITIASFWGAANTFFLLNKLHGYHGFNFLKNAWVFWCWLPIPILSIFLGFKYRNDDFKCKKNIVGGFIIGFLLLGYGSFCLFPTFSADYSKIEAYKNIIDAKLPENGELEIQNWGTSFEDDKTEYTIINAYYEKEDVTNLVNSIKKNNHWILSKNIKSELKTLLPSQLYSDKDAYFSIFNNTTKEYNTLPEETGNYEIFAMKYDKSDKCLEIHQFKYSFIK